MNGNSFLTGFIGKGTLQMSLQAKSLNIFVPVQPQISDG